MIKVRFYLINFIIISHLKFNYYHFLFSLMGLRRGVRSTGKLPGRCDVAKKLIFIGFIKMGVFTRD